MQESVRMHESAAEKMALVFSLRSQDSPQSEILIVVLWHGYKEDRIHYFASELTKFENFKNEKRGIFVFLIQKRNLSTC